MSEEIPEHHVQQYKSNVYHLVQQKGSKLRKCCQIEDVKAKAKFVDQIGSGEAQEISSRHSDTQYNDTPHARRQLTTRKIVYADLIDDEDKAKMLYDPASPYAEAGSMALGRKMDNIIVAAADGTAYAGEEGSTAVPFDTNMTVAVTERKAGVTSADYGLNVAKLGKAAELLGSNEVDQDEEKFMIVNARQIKSLLDDDRISSKDYNVLAPLYEGKVARFYGFNIVPCNRITTDANGDDKVLFWAKGGMAFGVSMDITTKIEPLASKNYATQVYVAMMVGATRLEEARVGRILCDPTAGPGA